MIELSRAKEVIKRICDHFKINEDTLISMRVDADTIKARKWLCYLLKEVNYDNREIAQIAHVHHVTVQCYWNELRDHCLYYEETRTLKQKLLCN